MAEKLDPKELATIEEVAISNMWEITGVVEVLERKGILTRQELLDAIRDLHERHPEATTLERPARGNVRRPQ